MSKKYISQVNNYNFVYPNNTVAEYDDNIIHQINDNSVTGQVSGLTFSSVSSSGMTISFSYAYQLNGAEPYINNGSGKQTIFSVHLMAGGQSYYKPWRMIDFLSATPTVTGSTGYTSYTITGVTPSSVGLSSFENGTYYLEIRFVGKRAIYPVCISGVISSIIPPPSPTPTPSATPLPASPTPTPSATPGLPGPSPTPTMTPSASPGAGIWDYYLAEEYNCQFPGCSLTNPSILVKVTRGPALVTGYYYPDYYANGKVYRIISDSTSGIAVRLAPFGFDNCASACEV